MAKVVLVGYGKMLYSLIEGISQTKHQILGVLRNDRIKYNSFELFFKDIFNPSLEKTILKIGMIVAEINFTYIALIYQAISYLY